jgi:hypothetical protein
MAAKERLAVNFGLHDHARTCGNGSDGHWQRRFHRSGRQLDVIDLNVSHCLVREVCERRCDQQCVRLGRGNSDHLTQNTGDEIFWAGHNGNTKLTVYSLKEGSNTYFWRDVGISSWANNAPTSMTPDNQDWLAKNFNGPGVPPNSFPRNGIIGAAQSGNQLWFGWTAGTDDNFKQAHIEIVTLDRGNNFSKTQQVQVWNNNYAFAYPSFSSNACTGELGMSFEYGGNGNFENHVAGFWGDFLAYITTNSDVGTDRFGDYVTIRRAPTTQNATSHRSQLSMDILPSLSM